MPDAADMGVMCAHAHAGAAAGGEEAYEAMLHKHNSGKGEQDLGDDGLLFQWKGDTSGSQRVGPKDSYAQLRGYGGALGRCAAISSFGKMCALLARRSSGEVCRRKPVRSSLFVLLNSHDCS